MRTILLVLLTLLSTSLFSQNYFTDSYGSVALIKMSTLRNYYDTQSDGTPQQIWQDPVNPNNIHALYMHSRAEASALFPRRNVFYFFSSNAGLTWVNLDSIDTSPVGFGMITGLSNGLPLIAAQVGMGGVTPNTYIKIYTGNTIGTANFNKLNAGGINKFYPRIISTANVSNTNKFFFMGVANITPDTAYFNIGTSLTQSNFTGYTSFHMNERTYCALGRGSDGRIGMVYVTTGSANLGDVYFMESTNDGATFNTPLKIYQQSTNPDTARPYRSFSLLYESNTPKIVFETYKSIQLPSYIRFWSPTLTGSDPNRSIVIADSGKIRIPAQMPSISNPLLSITKPSIGISSDGSMLFCAFMGADTAYVIDEPPISYKYHYYNIYATRSSNGGSNWTVPEMITPTFPRQDWEFVSVSPVNNDDANNYFFNMTVQKDTIPGSYLYQNRTPLSDLTNAQNYFLRVGYSKLTTAPSAPVLVSPANNATGVSFTPTLSWTSNGLLHKLQLSLDSAFSNILYQKDSIPVMQYTMPVSVLQANTKYFWRVNARNEHGTGPFSTTFSFTVMVSNIPVAPGLLSPLNGATDVSQPVHLDWTSVPQAETYRVQVSAYQDFHDEIYFDSSNIVASEVISKIIPSGKTFFWRANAKNSFGTSTYSAIFTFTTVPLTAPQLVSPLQQEIVTVNPVLKWRTILGATSYELIYSVDSNFQSSYTTMYPTDTLETLSNLFLNKKYYWKVRGKSFNIYGPTSSVWNFKTAISPPTLVSPTNGQQGVLSNPTLRWNTVNGRTSYNFMVSSNVNFTDTVYSNNADTTFFNIPTEVLQLNTFYYWKVRSKDSVGFGVYSTVWNFKVRTTGIQPISEIIPTEYKLFNNYPNPFNPTTKIKFDLPQNSFVKINVFDITGKMINEIVNMNLNAGSYETEFNGANFSSGIYYYRIEAGNFAQTKKMILIK